MNLAEAKAHKIKLIEEYDKSIGVNSFYLNGELVWLDKATRVGLVNALNMEKLLGKTETTLWFDTQAFTLPIDTAIQLMGTLENYAKECYNTTMMHIKKVSESNDIEYVNNYNYINGYPTRPKFNVNYASEK